MIAGVLVAFVVSVICLVAGRERGREDTMREVMCLPPPAWPEPKTLPAVLDRPRMEQILTEIRGGELDRWNRRE